MEANSELDLESLGRILESRYALVLEAAARYAPGRNLVFDVVQQTFLVFVRGLAEGKWTLESNIDPLLYGIARNTALHMGRIERKNTPEALRMISSRLARALNDAGELNRPEEGHEKSEARLRALKECMDKLPEQKRAFFEMHYRRGMTLEKIAKQHGIQPNTLRRMFSRLRVKLRECVERHVADPE